MIQPHQPIYRSSGFLKSVFSLAISGIQEILNAPLVSSPLIDQAVKYLYKVYTPMQFTTATTWITLSEFLFTALVIWSILHLFGKHIKAIVALGILITIGTITGKLAFI